MAKDPRYIMVHPSVRSELAVPLEVREAAMLTDYATFARYPGPGEPVTASEYATALDLARRVVRWAESLLAPPPEPGREP